MRKIKDILAGLHPAFDHRNRLALMAILINEECAEYNTLKELLHLTDGNLAGHLRALESAACITARKLSAGPRIQTTYAVTPNGRAIFKIHLDALEALLEIGRED